MVKVQISYKQMLFALLIRPAKHLAHGKGIAPHAQQRHQDDDEIQHDEHHACEHESRVEDAVEHEVTPQPAGPAHGREGLDGKVRDEDAEGSRDRLQHAALLGADLPEGEEGHAGRGEDGAGEGVEGHDQGGPGVSDGEERDEGGVPLDTGQGGLVAGLEVVEVAQEGKHDGADGAGLEVVEIKNFGQGEDLPHHERKGTSTHGLREEEAADEEVQW